MLLDSYRVKVGKEGDCGETGRFIVGAIAVALFKHAKRVCQKPELIVTIRCYVDFGNRDISGSSA
jgi:hypothetical protein